MMITLAGLQVDLSKSLPLKLRDWKNLEKLGVSNKSLRDGSLTEASIVIFYVLNKANNQITQDMVDDLSVEDPTLSTVLDAINSTDKIDPGFLPTSTDSPPSTAGT
jgi:hypothetical protein